jgi:hypothetical protein
MTLICERMYWRHSRPQHVRAIGTEGKALNSTHARTTHTHAHTRTHARTHTRRLYWLHLSQRNTAARHGEADSTKVSTDWGDKSWLWYLVI